MCQEKSSPGEIVPKLLEYDFSGEMVPLGNKSPGSNFVYIVIKVINEKLYLKFCSCNGMLITEFCDSCTFAPSHLFNPSANFEF